MASLSEQIRAAAARLADAGVSSPRHDAEVLAAHVLGIDRGQLVTQPEPGPSFTAGYQDLVNRRADRVPLQHLVGVAHFRHITVRVGPGVFVPRPETELVAGAAVDEARARAAAGAVPVVVDLFSGSGAIALAVATEVRPVLVHAVERDEQAVAWLRRNVAGSAVIVHHDDVAQVAERSLSMLLGAVDVVVANPPYGTADEVPDPEVARHDPATAVFSGDDGLEAMRVLEPVAFELLKPGGLVVAEHGDDHAESAPAVFRATDRWTDVADHRDLNDRPRYLTARARSLTG